MFRKLLPLFFATALPALAQDTRTVTEPTFPPVCTMLPAQMAIVANGPASETTPDTARIQAALTACASGSAVELAASGSNYAFLSAPLNIPSGVSLIVDGGVTLFASRNREDYQTATISSTVDECGTDGTNGNGCKNFLIFANGSTNVGSGLYGYGVIDGRGYATTLKAGADTGVSWWQNADNYVSPQSQNNPILMKLSKSTNFTLYKITLRNSPEFHVGWSGTGFTAWGVKIQAPWTAHNTDGIDPQGTNVTITNSSISDGDDQIAVGASSASANITIQNVTAYSGHGLSVGSYTQGGLTNMLVQNVNMAGQPGDGNEDGIRLKSALDRGGLLKNLTYSNICMRDVRKALYLTPYYNTNTGTLYPQFTNIAFNNIHVLAPTGTYANTFSIQGYDANHQSTVTLNNVVYDTLTAANTLANYTTFTLSGNVYPAFLQSQTTAGVTYTGTATATATPAYDCTAASTFPYEVGELYLSTTGANNLQTAAITTAGSVTLNAMLQPAKATQGYSGTAGSYTGAAAMTQPVQFLEGTTVVGSAALAANGTLASLSLTGVKAGTHTYTAYYPGDTNYAALTFGSVTVTATTAALATTTTTLSPPATPVVYGTAVTFSASVATATGTPTGSIRFLDGTSTVLATVALTGTGASTTQTLGGGAHSITAVYLGDGNYAISTSTASALTVTPVLALLTTTASPTAITLGSSTVVKANLPPVAGASAPTGTLSILDGGTIVASGAPDATGSFSATITPATPGTHTYSSTYSGDANYAATTISSTASVVDKSISVTTLKITGGTTYGSVSTIAPVVAAGGTVTTTLTPTGNVILSDTTGAVGGLSGLIIPANGSTQLVILAGPHTVTAAYQGDANFNSSSGTPVTFTITPVAPGLVLTLGAASVATGGSTTLTATLNPVSGGAIPTGTVIFYDGTTAVGNGTVSSGKLTVTPTFTTVGAHSITAAYSGDGNYTALNSAASTLTVTGTPFITLSVAPSAVTLAPGGSTSAPLATVLAFNGFTGAVTLSCTSPVSYVTCAPITPALSPATSTSSITVSVAATVAASHPAPFQLPRTTWFATLLPLAFFSRKRRKLRNLLALAFLITITTLTGCGGGTTATTTTSPKLPPAGTQTLTLTATSSAATVTTPITVTITN